MNKPANQDRELEKKLDQLFSWEIDGKKEPVIFRPELKEGMKAFIRSERREAVGEVLDKILQEYGKGELPLERLIVRELTKLAQEDNNG